MKKSCLLLLCLAFSGIALQAQDRTQWFEFYLPWDDSTVSVTNLASYLDAPAGKHGFVKVTPEGHFAFENNPKTIRFVGAVNVALANYPTAAQARVLAARMAKFGINLVRIHLTDVDGTSGLFDNSTLNTQLLNTTRMDKMDYFTKCLKEKGIYYNFCIQSGRVFKAGDTLDSPVVNEQSKYVTLFNPRLVELQKRFARQTLMHVNPYTGLSYANDPAMATVELTNENSLFNGWFGWQRDFLFAGTSGGIGNWYSRELDTLFNKWIVEKYPNDSILAANWKGEQVPLSEKILNNSFENNYTSWATSVSTSYGAQASFTIDTLAFGGTRSAKIQVDQTGTAGWHVQIKTNNYSVVKDQGYKISFYARSNVKKPVVLEIMENQTWYYYGGPSYTPDTSWQKFEYYFTATKASNMMILQFDYGLQTGTFWLDSVSVTPYGGEGLEEGESLALMSVKRTPQTEIGKYSMQRIGDNAAFYFSLEEKYTRDLQKYLQDSCGIKCPITFTNNYFGLASIYAQSKADYMDTHFYWDHPSFPAGWSETNFTMQNKSMLKDPAGSTINHIPFCRVKGKPLLLSEYNHPYPQIYQGEAPSILFAYGAFHDLDGILWHAYYDYMNNYTIRKQDMFFDIAMNPVVMTQMLLSVPYRSGYITPSTDVVYANYKESDIFGRTKIVQDKYMLHLPDGETGNSFLEQSFACKSFTADSSYLEGTLAMPGSKIVSSTGELTWDATKGILTINNPFWQGATGILKSQTIQLQDITISGITTTDGLGFASIQLLSMDSLPIRESKKLVLLTSARLENQGFLWNSSKTTPLNLGGTKALCEPVNATVTLKFGVRDSFHIYRLDERGARSTELTVFSAAGSTRLLLNEKTLWYELLNDSARAESQGLVKIPGKAQFTSQPNPCTSSAMMNISLPNSQQVNVLLCDARGKLLIQKRVQVEGGSLFQENLDLTGQPAGLYFCGIQLQNGEKTFQKLVKMGE